MHIFITGATGFLGRSLVLRLMRDGHTISAWVRSPVRARALFGTAAELVPVADGDIALQQAVERADVVVNLAGAPILQKRWTRARQRELEASRIGVTERLVSAMRACRTPPSALVSASAIGFYGDRGSDWQDETQGPGTGFAARLCQAWEEAALGAASDATRVAVIRIGVVLGRDGGVLQTMLRPFRLGIGGPLGSGRQYIPWIHVRDMVEILAQAVTDEDYRGVINGVAPDPASNRDVTRGVARALRRPGFVRTPATVLRLALGESSCLLLDSVRVRPGFLLERGFQFQFTDLQAALYEALRPSPRTTFEIARGEPRAPYLTERRPRYLLRHKTRIDAPLSEVFEFFSKAENLSLITPAGMEFDIVTPVPVTMGPGTVIDYKIKLGPVPMSWRTVIEDWQPGRKFVDAQHRGPYRCWWHEHHFEADGDTTLMEDRVYYTPPLGLLGRLSNRLFVRRMLGEIFSYREQAIGLRFGRAVENPTAAQDSSGWSPTAHSA